MRDSLLNLKLNKNLRLRLLQMLKPLLMPKLLLKQRLLQMLKRQLKPRPLLIKRYLKRLRRQRNTKRKSLIIKNHTKITKRYNLT
jgi:hypothetical protein